MNSHFRTRPFNHLVIAPFLSDAKEMAVISELQKTEWQPRASTFYRFSVPRADSLDTRLREMLRPICTDIRLLLEDSFGCNLAMPTHSEIHRYGTGDGIGPHTDAKIPEVRCILNLNAGWSVSDGGIWIFATNSALAGDRSQLPSINNSAFAFSTGPTTFHALSIRRASVGYAVTIRFPRQ